MTRLVTSVDNTLNDPQFSHGAGDTMRGAFTSSTSRGATVSCSSVGMVSIAALPALMEESTSCGLSLESALMYYASDIPRSPYTTSTAADGLGIHGAHDTCSVNPFSRSARCHASAHPPTARRDRHPETTRFALRRHQTTRAAPSRSRLHRRRMSTRDDYSGRPSGTASQRICSLVAEAAA